MAVLQRRLSIREQNDYYRLNVGIVPQEPAAAPISFYISPSRVQNAGSVELNAGNIIKIQVFGP